MRGGLERWKRGVDSHGVRAAIAYALKGECDAAARPSRGVDALTAYAETAVARFTVSAGTVRTDELDRDQLEVWVDGRDPLTGERRGRVLDSPTADLVLDGTINAPKSYSLVTLLHPELAREYDALQDRLRDRVIVMWQRELNARRGAGGRIREQLDQVEVVELRHARSRALDPHIHRHLWLNVRVKGRDEQWSNVDSRVAMKMHTLINAEGELAARTDPQWIGALARYGYSLNGDGEIEQVAHAVRPLSRRSNQIEKNRALLLAKWRASHPGRQPGPVMLQKLDRQAWALGRPAKPSHFDEREWESLIREELEEIDPDLTRPRAPCSVADFAPDEVDLDLLAAKAIVDADARSATSGGRFSMFDLRAGATRAVAASGLVGARWALQSTIDDVVTRALPLTIALLDQARQRPAHVKGLMALTTASLKRGLAGRFDGLACPGIALSDQAMRLLAQSALAANLLLDASQARAAGTIAGSDRLVTITGPAGTGKTTTLRVARHALALQGRQMIVVAPTKKSASVAAREVGVASASLHGLLADHGWRWGRDSAGAALWTRLAPDDIDAITGMRYTGPTRYPIGVGDRIVVDEAGMVDLHTANALAELAAETGAGIAMVGDHLQAMPVGHAGAMACMAQRSDAVVELDSVHRFRDPSYAQLTLRLRQPGSRDAARGVARELDDRGLIRRVDDDAGAQDAMVDAYFRWSGDHARIALVTGTNDEADAINDAIQDRRIELGQLSLTRIAIGRGEQRILEGDIVQTRRNDTSANVENRALWTVARITHNGMQLVSMSDSSDIRTVSTDYVADHIHLAYASTVHGIQGETTDVSIVGPGVDASGLYVGMTRGRARNEVIAIAATDAAAREAIAENMMRGTIEVTLDDARSAARAELGRAARWPADHTARSDPAARPFGREQHMARVEATLREDSNGRLEQIAAASAWLVEAEVLVAQLELEGTRASAAAHGRRGVATSSESDVLTALRDRIDTRSEELEQMMVDSTEAESWLARAIEESLRREVQNPHERAQEALARTLVGPGAVNSDCRFGVGIG